MRKTSYFPKILNFLKKEPNRPPLRFLQHNAGNP